MANLPRETIWYLVLSAHEARLLRALPKAAGADPGLTVYHGPDRKLRDSLQDRPTRSFASAGGGRRSGVEPGSDPLHEDARGFLAEICADLSERHRKSGFDGLVLIGSPEMIGIWRSEAPEALKKLVRREFVRNLVPLPNAELVPAIRALLSE